MDPTNLPRSARAADTATAGAPVSPAAERVSCVDWPRGLRAYLVAIAIGNLLWETAHLPLYTIWNRGTLREKAFAVVHCTGGDVLIALTALSLALVIVGAPGWPVRGFWRVLAVTVALGVAYTIFSEWLNIVVRASWAYSERMPVVPFIGTGASPLLQWVLVPVLAMCGARRAAVRRPQRIG